MRSPASRELAQLLGVNGRSGASAAHGQSKSNDPCGARLSGCRESNSAPSRPAIGRVRASGPRISCTQATGRSSRRPPSPPPGLVGAESAGRDGEYLCPTRRGTGPKCPRYCEDALMLVGQASAAASLVERRTRMGTLTKLGGQCSRARRHPPRPTTRPACAPDWPGR